MAIPLIIVLIFITNLVSSTYGSKVEYLPGFEGPLPFHLETGYVGVGESESVQLFYYFVKSESKPEKDPLLIWLTGGPGCSSWSGLVYEVGPLNYRTGQYNGTLPTFVLNQHSWTKISSIIFVDSPVGTGFSYSTNQSVEAGDFQQVQGLLQFLKKWLIDVHPEFLSNPFYVAGDSYSGITVPILFQEISNGIEEGTIPPINLKGYVLGNPFTSSSDSNYRIPFAHGMAIISDELYLSLERSCGGKYDNIDPSNAECVQDFQAYEKCISGVEEKFILEPLCVCDAPKAEETSSRRRWLNQNSDKVLNLIEPPVPPMFCRECDHLLSQHWADDPNVRKALHVKEGSVKAWVRCLREKLSFHYDVSSSFEYHVNSSARGFRSLVYSGDHDMMVPYLATQAWIRALNYSIVDDWRSWIVHGEVAGYTRTYSNEMTFATVKGAGHTAPQYKPKECFAMFKRWIDYEPL